MFKNITGRRFGQWRVIRRAGYLNSGGVRWLLQCACGTKRYAGLWTIENRIRRGCRACVTKTLPPFRHRHPERYLWHAAKNRARSHGLCFTIKETDIVIPTHCPVFGTKLGRVGTGKQKSAPSLDRFIPKKGYVPGNVAVISHAANRLKNNATLAQIAALYRYMRRHSQEPI